MLKKGTILSIGIKSTYIYIQRKIEYVRERINLNYKFYNLNIDIYMFIYTKTRQRKKHLKILIQKYKIRKKYHDLVHVINNPSF
jgi:hypothetical protein